jgi:hypothetical protein
MGIISSGDEYAVLKFQINLCGARDYCLNIQVFITKIAPQNEKFFMFLPLMEIQDYQ